jgi:methionyl-tRNA synthetase
MYVWFDALSNYITALGFGSDDTEKFDKFWHSATHLVGKDILRQHTIYWFAFLLAAGIELPKNVFAHGMWLDRAGRKMSKTIGNTVDLAVLRRHFQLDAIRYFLLREMNFGGDGRFSYENLLERANADLASGLGNLASRTLTMINRYCEGRVPQVLQANSASDLSRLCSQTRDDYLRFFDELAFSNALETAWNLIAQTDKFISDGKPWNLAKDETRRGELELILATSHEVLRWLAVMLHPVMPEATNSIWRQAGFAIRLENLDPLDLKWANTTATNVSETIEGIFPRIDKLKTMNDINNETAHTSSIVESPTHGNDAASTASLDNTHQPKTRPLL